LNGITITSTNLNNWVCFLTQMSYTFKKTL
jgi:hypothetical protein